MVPIRGFNKRNRKETEEQLEQLDGLAAAALSSLQPQQQPLEHCSKKINVGERGRTRELTTEQPTSSVMIPSGGEEERREWSHQTQVEEVVNVISVSSKSKVPAPESQPSTVEKIGFFRKLPPNLTEHEFVEFFRNQTQARKRRGDDVQSLQYGISGSSEFKEQTTQEIPESPGAAFASVLIKHFGDSPSNDVPRAMAIAEGISFLEESPSLGETICSNTKEHPAQGNLESPGAELSSVLTKHFGDKACLSSSQVLEAIQDGISRLPDSRSLRKMSTLDLIDSVFLNLVESMMHNNKLRKYIDSMEQNYVDVWRKLEYSLLLLSHQEEELTKLKESEKYSSKAKVALELKVKELEYELGKVRQELAKEREVTSRVRDELKLKIQDCMKCLENNLSEIQGN